MVVLLHAFPLDERMWEPQVAPLERLGAGVQAPRLYGLGSSIDEWSERLLAGSDGRLVLVGASMGGYAALAVARRAPERLAGLALVGARPDADDDARRQGREATIERIHAGGAAALWDDMAPKLFPAAAPGEATDAARRMTLARPAEELVAAVAAMRDRPDSGAALRALDVPVLVAVGEEDPFFPPSEAEALVRELRDGELAVFPGVGHLPSLESPDEFNARLARFLERCR